MTAKRDIDIFYIALYNLDKIYNVSYFSEEKIFGFIEENLESFFNTEESLLDWKLKMLENINDPLNQIDFKYSESHKGWYLESNQNPIFIKSVSDPINFIPQELKKKLKINLNSNGFDSPNKEDEKSIDDDNNIKKSNKEKNVLIKKRSI